MSLPPPIRNVGFIATEGPGATLERKRNPVWLVLAVLLGVAGIGALVYGIVETVASNDAKLDAAVVRGQVSALGSEPNAEEFEVTKGGTYTTYVILDTNSENERDQIVAATECRLEFADRSTAHIDGSRQASASTVGDVSSIGYFDAPIGEARISCEQTEFGRSSLRDRLGSEPEFFVSPGSPNEFLSIAFIIGGAFVIVAAVFPAIKFARSGVRHRKGFAPVA